MKSTRSHLFRQFRVCLYKLVLRMIGTMLPISNFDNRSHKKTNLLLLRLMFCSFVALIIMSHPASAQVNHPRHDFRCSNGRENHPDRKALQDLKEDEEQKLRIFSIQKENREVLLKKLAVLRLLVKIEKELNNLKRVAELYQYIIAIGVRPGNAVVEERQSR